MQTNPTQQDAPEPQRTGWERLEQYRPVCERIGAEVTAWDYGKPRVIEHDGTPYVERRREEDRANLQRALDYGFCIDVVTRLGGPDAALALNKYGALNHEREEEHMRELLKSTAVFLVGHAQRRLWTLLYLHLKSGGCDNGADVINNTMCVAGYEEGDEWRFLWGAGWRETLASTIECEAEDARERARLDGEIRDEDLAAGRLPPGAHASDQPLDVEGVRS